MKRSFSELREKITGYIGERNDDESLEILEDVADTLTDEPEDWHEKYNQLDADWRKRYRDRFNGVTDDSPLSEEARREDENAQEEREEEIEISDILKED